MAVLVALSVVGPRTMGPDSLVVPQAWPLLPVAMIQGWLAIRRRESWRGLVAAGCAVAAISGGAWGSWSAETTISVGFHLALLSVLALGATFDDELGSLLRVLGAWMLGGAAAAVMVGDPHLLACLPPGSDRVYPLLMAAVAAGYGYACGGLPYYVVSGASWAGS